MTNSYKSYSTTLEKMAIKEKHSERRDWKEKQENIKRKEWLKLMKTRDDEGIGLA